MAHYQHHVDRVVVFFSGELTFDAAVDLVDTLEMLIGVYFYALVDLFIASPSGVATSLDHYLDAPRRWRDAGVRGRDEEECDEPRESLRARCGSRSRTAAPPGRQETSPERKPTRIVAASVSRFTLLLRDRFSGGDSPPSGR